MMPSGNDLWGWQTTIDRRSSVLYACMLAAMSIIAFWPSYSGGFLGWDDQQIIVNNPGYRGLSPENMKWMFTSTLMGHYQPLTWISYAVDHALWGMNPLGYRLSNAVIHALNAILVFLLGQRLQQAAARSPVATRGMAVAAFIGAALWAVHPLRVESVAWVTERRDVLSTLFMLLAMLAYLRSVRPEESEIRFKRWYVLAIAMLALSLLSKAWGMTFFVLLIAVDWYPLRRLPENPLRFLAGGPVRVLLQKAPFFILGVLAAFMAAKAQHSAIATKSLQEWGILERCVQATYGLWFCIRASILPIDLSPLYELPVKLNPFDPAYIPAYVLVPLGIVLVLIFRRRAPAAVTAGVVYAVMLGPVLGLLQSGDQFVADRYSYIAMIGLSLLAGWGVVHAAHRMVERDLLTRAKAVLGGVILVMAALVLMSMGQSTFWRDTLSLWARASTASPGSIVHTNHALVLLEQQPPRTDEAVAQLSLAIQANPANGRALFTLGNILRDRGDYVRAELAYIEAIKVLPQRYVAQVNLGALYLKHLNQPLKAVQAFRDAVVDVERGGRRPLSAMPYLALGDALKRTGDVEGARASFTRALEFEETRAQAQAELDAIEAASPIRRP